MITTFEFYQKTYYGDSIKESSDFDNGNQEQKIS